MEGAGSRAKAGNRATTQIAGLASMADLQTEEQRMEAVLKMGEEQWKQQREEMKQCVDPLTCVDVMLM